MVYTLYVLHDIRPGVDGSTSQPAAHCSTFMLMGSYCVQYSRSCLVSQSINTACAQLRGTSLAGHPRGEWLSEAPRVGGLLEEHVVIVGCLTRSLCSLGSGDVSCDLHSRMYYARIIGLRPVLLPLQDEWALPVPMPGLDGGKAHTITTGTPGNSCTSYEAAERAHEGGESRSSMSLVNPLSSLESVHTGQTLGGGGKMRSLPVMGEEEELPTPMSPMSPGGSMSADDSRLRRSSRNHSSDGKPVRGLQGFRIGYP